MWKKLVSGFLAMMFLTAMVLTASAEDTFTLRNGVQFGDTMEQVKAKETLTLKSDTDGCLVMEKGTVAGISDVQIEYYFDENGKLEEVMWGLPERSYADSSDSDYSKLYKALAQKYGFPLGYTGGSCYIITGRALEGITLLCYLSEWTDMYGDLRDYDEWVWDFGQGEHVKIEIAQGCWGSSVLDADYHIFVGYKYFTDADLQEAQDEKQQENQAVMDDI